MIVVLVTGKPFELARIRELADAVLVQWYAGEEAGASVAGILFGKTNPSGRLPVSFPQSTGHLPCYYNHLSTDKGYYNKKGSPDSPGRDYVFSDPEPLYPFGYGLSYTRFEYSGMETVSGELSATDTLRVNVRVKNTGSRAGSEVVQLYVRDLISSVATPVRQLHAFDKVELNPGEERSVRFSIPVPQLSLYDADMRRIVEPGDFELQVGASSRDIRLRDTVTVAGCTDIPDPKATGVKAGAVREPGSGGRDFGNGAQRAGSGHAGRQGLRCIGSRTCGRDRQTRKIHPPYPDQRPGRLRTGRLRTPGDRRHGGRQPRHRVGTGHELTQNH